MICAGDEALFNEIKDNDLTLVGKASFFLGDIGKGSRMKLAVNMVMGKFVSTWRCRSRPPTPFFPSFPFLFAFTFSSVLPTNLCMFSRNALVAN